MCSDEQRHAATALVISDTATGATHSVACSQCTLTCLVSTCEAFFFLACACGRDRHTRHSTGLGTRLGLRSPLHPAITARAQRQRAAAAVAVPCGGAVRALCRSSALAREPRPVSSSVRRRRRPLRSRSRAARLRFRYGFINNLYIIIKARGRHAPVTSHHRTVSHTQIKNNARAHPHRASSMSRVL
jgi:hypothetical protein